MADSYGSDWSDSGKASTRSGSSKKKSGPPTWLRVLSPISNLASLKRGGKVKKRGKTRKAAR
jgi:hypothetical protein